MRRTFLLFFFLFITLVHAEIVVHEISDDFTVFAEQEFRMCACGSSQKDIYIKNQGNIPLTFSLKPKTFTSISPEHFSLPPARTAKLTQTVQASCDKGFLDTGFIVTTSTGKTQEVNQLVKTDRCQNLIIQPVVVRRTILPCSPASYAIMLSNPLSFKETYNLRLDFKGNASYTHELTLAGKTAELFNLTLIPDCSLSGNITPDLQVWTSKTRLQAELPLEMQIIPAYDYAVDLRDAVTLCDFDRKTYEVTIKNKASLSNTYTLQIDGPDWITPRKDKIILAPAQEEEIDLLLTPELGSNGSETLSLEVIPRYGSTISKDIAIDVEDCYSFTVQAEERICADEDSIDITIHNTGSRPGKFKVMAMGRYQKEHSIASGEFLTLKVPLEELDRKLIYNISNRLRKEEAWQNLERVAKRDCYKPSIKPRSWWVPPKGSSRSMNITNTGIKKAEYLLSTSADWLSFEERVLKLEPGESRIIHFSALPKSQGKHTPVLKLDEANAGLYNESMTVWAYDKAILLCGVLLSIVFLVLVVLIFRFFFTEKRSIIKILLTLIVLLLILFLCFPRLSGFFNLGIREHVDESLNQCSKYFNESLCASEQYLAWDEDTSVQLNLSRYFSDPDDDILTYKATGNEHITISFDRDIADMVPARNWHGIEVITFTAFDPDQANITSQPFYLHVLSRADKNMGNYISEWGRWVILSMILVIVLYIILIKKREL